METRNKAPRRAAAPPRPARGTRSGTLSTTVPTPLKEDAAWALPDVLFEPLLELIAADEPKSAGALLCVCRRFRRLGVAAKGVWRAMLAASEYGELLPRLSLSLSLEALLAADPHAAAARLLSRRCAHCAGAGEYWFTLQRCRVCRSCFEEDLPDPSARAKEFPTSTLDDFLPAAASGAAAARHPPPLCAYLTRTFAKNCFLLTDKMVNALPCLQLRGDEAKRTGIALGADVCITLVTAGDCLKAAVARFGSVAALAAAAAARREEAAAVMEEKGPGGKLPASLKVCCNFPHLNQARHSVFTHREGLGLQYAVRPPFFRTAGAKVLTVAAPGDASDAAESADFVSLGAALAAAAAGDVIELLPGLHRTDTDADAEDADDRAAGGTYVHKAVTIRGAAGGEKPTLVAAGRVLSVTSSCALERLCLRAVPAGGGDDLHYPSLLVCSLFAPGHNRDIHVTITDCRLQSRYPVASALITRTQEGAPLGRTLTVLRGCEVSGNVRSMGNSKCIIGDDCAMYGQHIQDDEEGDY